MKGRSAPARAVASRRPRKPADPRSQPKPARGASSAPARAPRGAAPPAPRATRRARSFHPLTPDRWPDLEALFGERGGCGGCWCMWPRLTARDFGAGKGAGNRSAFRRIVTGGGTPGILAYVNGEVAGWCALGPRAGFRRLDTSRVLAPVDDQPVWSVVCFFIARPYRRQGLTVELLRQAARFAARHGARILEGYPVEPRGSTADAFAWTGLVASFRRAGFEEVLRRSETRPIMRQALTGRGRG
jgi:GNAT superfamily N-acetyltransferase